MISLVEGFFLDLGQAADAVRRPPAPGPADAGQILEVHVDDLPSAPVWELDVSGIRSGAQGRRRAAPFSALEVIMTMGRCLAVTVASRLGMVESIGPAPTAGRWGTPDRPYRLVDEQDHLVVGGGECLPSLPSDILLDVVHPRRRQLAVAQPLGPRRHTEPSWAWWWT